MTHEPNIIRAQKHWRAIEGLLLGLYGMVWLRYGMSSFLIPWLWSVVYWTASVIVILPAILNIRANYLPAELSHSDSNRRTGLWVVLSNVLLIVLAFVLGFEFQNSQPHMVAALSVLAGIYLAALAAPLRYPLLYVLGALSVVWALVAPSLVGVQNAAGGIAFGTGALLWVGSVASYDRPDPD